MKFKVKEKRNPNKDEIRIISKFLFFPVKIGNEIRWLEIAYICQVFTEVYSQSFKCQWINYNFTTKQNYIISTKSL